MKSRKGGGVSIIELVIFATITLIAALAVYLAVEGPVKDLPNFTDKSVKSAENTYGGPLGTGDPGDGSPGSGGGSGPGSGGDGNGNKFTVAWEKVKFIDTSITLIANATIDKKNGEIGSTNLSIKYRKDDGSWDTVGSEKKCFTSSSSEEGDSCDKIETETFSDYSGTDKVTKFKAVLEDGSGNSIASSETGLKAGSIRATKIKSKIDGEAKAAYTRWLQ